MQTASGRDRNRFIRQIINSIRCAVCRRHYGGDDVRLLGRRDELWVMRVVCEHCSTQGLVFALVKGAHELEVIGELTPQEEDAFASQPPIGMDDVLDVRRRLRDLEGGLEELFEPGS